MKKRQNSLTFRILVRQDNFCYEQVKLFENFYSYLVERIGETSKTIVHYNLINSSMNECAERFIKEGFKEVTND